MAHGQRLTDLAGRPAISRRGLLTGAAAGGGLLVAWSLWPREYAGVIPHSEGDADFGAWLSIAPDGTVTVAVPQLEMGQGVSTVLAQIVAHELGADWRQIAVLPVPPTGAQPNPALAAKWAPLWSPIPMVSDSPSDILVQRFARSHAFNATAEGTTLAAYEGPARLAGASARALLAMAAGRRWNLSWEGCEVRGGLVMAAGRLARFGELAQEAARFEVPDPVPLRSDPPSETPVRLDSPRDEKALTYPRLDLPAKVDGAMVFAADVRLPGMVYAAIRHGPVGTPRLAAHDSAGKPTRGAVRFVANDRWIAATAPSWWEAERALAAVKTTWAGPGAIDSAPYANWLAQAAREPARVVADFGNAGTALADGDAVSHAVYTIAPAIPAGLETASATARYTGGTLELWVASQAPQATREAAARALGIRPNRVVLYPVPAGGSFDARLDTPHAVEAALIAAAVGRPVQLTWSREQEMLTVAPRAPVTIALAAKYDPESQLPKAWRARLACPATVSEFGARLFDGNRAEEAVAAAKGRTDALACEGAVPPYGIGAVLVEHAPVSLPLPTGRMRGNAAAYTAFATECFVDELARGAGRDPLLYRMAMLGARPRLAAVLQRAARLGEWDGGRPGSGQGLALVRMDGAGPANGVGAGGGGRIACVARARMLDGGLRVDRLTAVVDIGRIVNADIARQQIEGGLLFGVGVAAGQSLSWRQGRPEPTRLEGLRLPILANAPVIEVEFVPSTAPPFDPGELGVAVAPPAIANALFAATGVRIRNLPLVGNGT